MKKNITHILILTFLFLGAIGFFASQTPQVQAATRINGGLIWSFTQAIGQTVNAVTGYFTSLTATTANVGTLTTTGNAASNFYSGISVGKNGVAGTSGVISVVDGTNPGNTASLSYSATANAIAISTLGSSTGSLVATGSGFSLSSANVQTFVSSGAYTWHKPANVQTVFVRVIGGGGGGGSGRVGNATSVRCGGGAGAGGGYSQTSFPASWIGDTENVQIGYGGVGGNSVSSNDTSGNGGHYGTASYFGDWLTATGSGGGSGGTLTSGTAATAGAGINAGGTGGSASSTGLVGTSGTKPGAGGSGGGSGGGITSANVSSAGGAGVGTAYAYLPSIAGGLAGGGSALSNATWCSAGVGGGGGNSSNSYNAQSGGNAGLFGSGGGGGGSALNGFSSGNGGAGSDGCVEVVAW